MKKFITLIEIQFNQMSKSIAFTKNIQWIMAIMLLFAAATSFKKVTEVQGIVGLCPVVTTDPMDKAVDVSLNKIVGITFNTDMNPVTINATTFTIRNGSQIIPGTVSATANAAVFTFKPDMAL
jgi:cytochrome c oxidase assembly protein Cox11